MAIATDSTFSRRMRRVRSSAIMDLIKTTAGGDYISFASGLPDPELYPREALRAIAGDVLHEDPTGALQYGSAEGIRELRDWIAQRLRARGLGDATADHILLTHGSQQGIDLAARLFLDAGDRVLLESPTYLAALQVFDSYEADYEAVGVDAAGMDVESAIRRLAAAPPKLVFVLPNFQNPTGATLPLSRRRQLAEAASAAGVAVLEDDAYYDLRYEGDALPPVAALAPNPLAVYTGTFSKTIAPGFRVAWLYAQPEVVARLGLLKQLSDLQVGSLAQRVVLRYCTLGHLDGQIARLRETYGRRRDRMLAALEREMPAGVRWTRPDGGMFLFVTLPAGLDAQGLLSAALDRGIVYVPGSSFYPGGGGENTLRLNFVSAGEEAIDRGIATLGRLLRESG